jgi:RNA polymerase sigma factor (TIGR02999 family)
MMRVWRTHSCVPRSHSCERGGVVKKFKLDHYPGVGYLDRHHTPQPRIRGAIHRAHSASAKRSFDFVRTQLRSYGGHGAGGCFEQFGGRAVQEVAAGSLRQHPLHLPADCGIGDFKQSGAFRRPKLLRRFVQNLNLAPTVRGHFSVVYTLEEGAMADSSGADTTELLRAWSGGDSRALGQLTPRIYRELRRMAAHLLRRERPGYTLQSAELVHEVFLRLVNVQEVNWQHRAHFFAVSATLMRRILLDRARKRAATKRGAAPRMVDLDTALDVYSARARELVALDDALKTLASVDPRRARIVELRFFGGLSVEETAEVIKVSSDTVMRDWKLARAWLLTELSAQD